MMSELAKALVEAQQQMPEVPKAARANYGNYATLDDLISKTRPVLNRHGLSIQQFPHVQEHGMVLRTIVRHVSGEEVAADTPLLLGPKQDMQALGAAITYARRYAWGAALGIASEHDDDAQSVSAPIASSGAAEPTQEQPAFAHEPNPAREVVNSNLASDKQKGMIRALAKKLSLDPGDLDGLSKRDASAKITELKALEEMGAGAAAGGGGFVGDTDIPF